MISIKVGLIKKKTAASTADVHCMKYVSSPISVRCADTNIMMFKLAVLLVVVVSAQAQTWTTILNWETTSKCGAYDTLATNWSVGPNYIPGRELCHKSHLDVAGCASIFITPPGIYSSVRGYVSLYQVRIIYYTSVVQSLIVFP